ncbi:MAG: hypothetical protein ACYCQI_09890 [Gammaproteobacteria bacterium]
MFQRPTEKFKDVMRNLSSYSPVPKELKNDFEQFQKASKELSTIILLEEKQRPIFKIPNSERRARDYLRSKEEAEEEIFENETKAHRKKLAQLDETLRLIHKEIMEKQGKATWFAIKGYVDISEIDLKITDQNDTMKNEIAEESCCVRIFFPCCASSKVQSSAKIISGLSKKLDQDEKKTATDEQKINAAIKALQATRDATAEQINQLERNPPQEIKSSESSGKIQASINARRNEYYSAVSFDVMLQIKRAYTIYQNILIKLKEQNFDPPLAKESMSLLPPLRKLFESFERSLEVIVRDFYCSTKESRLIYFEDFSLPSDSGVSVRRLG